MIWFTLGIILAIGAAICNGFGIYYMYRDWGGRTWVAATLLIIALIAFVIAVGMLMFAYFKKSGISKALTTASSLAAKNK